MPPDGAEGLTEPAGELRTGGGARQLVEPRTAGRRTRRAPLPPLGARLPAPWLLAAAFVAGLGSAPPPGVDGTRPGPSPAT
ncbi:hypothetical protein ACIQOF_39075 [Streptomyces sp. NPDC091265]|uniref:hypothetical protein n=1 Tax=unclassified Streptomyces TaxID=2593676 RepID=UPI00344CBB77